LLPLAMLAGGVVAIAFGLTLGVVAWGPAALLGVLAAGISHAVRSLPGHVADDQRAPARSW